MQLILTILVFLGGLALVLIGAECLVNGASSVARRLGVSEFVIGLTIVAMGTSAPEMVVSFIASAEGNSDVSIGNVVGSNIFNTAMILGITALVRPLSVTRTNLYCDLPINLVISLLLVLLGMNHTCLGIGHNDELSQWDGLVFIVLFALYMGWTFRTERTDAAQSSGKQQSTVLSVLLIAGGLAALIFGGKWFVGSAQTLARLAGLSDKFIAITILAAGTSLPELATSVVAAAKGKGQLALGNIVGSNIFNILFILGCASIIHPLKFNGLTWVDICALLLCATVLPVCAFTGQRTKIDRAEGVCLLLIEIAYMAWLSFHASIS